MPGPSAEINRLDEQRSRAALTYVLERLHNPDPAQRGTAMDAATFFGSLVDASSRPAMAARYYTLSRRKADAGCMRAGAVRSGLLAQRAAQNRRS